MSPRARTGARRQPPDESFYAAALTEADRVALEEARHVDGLAEEVALLRVRLRDALVEHRDDAKLIETGVRLLIQSLLAHHRISPTQADELSDTTAGLLERFTEILRSADDI